MAIQTATMRNILVTAYTGEINSIGLSSTAPGGSAGTEITGGSYAKQTPSWSGASGSASSTTVTFSVAAGVTVAGVNLYNSSTYVDGGSLSAGPQTFVTAGTFAITVQYTQS